ncbi:DNA-binding transcriptional regulator, MerR family [Anaerocolumna jejuensis DSM 15929]|uniref:DNA-binding transcriptional regulator, MerR family n=1 Tax=Anaerocolumna jejuensis DSM 15929 TaxID=1121322 RepID=A0A1M7BFC9_9FIRM|nr:MerR family transcriptional regulator [Anaerocolumna jejuensis]SHL53651.1 DNA-binding transcriptional regulator, MerR family [Anaerocolumna jejuensis DSM 15929]
MDNSILLSIGQLAKICNVSHKTLRYYDNLGLLKPTMVNQENGYRFYSKWHVARIMTIKQLQDIGVSLTEIKSFLQKDGSANVIESLQNILTEQENELEEQIQQLQGSLRKVKLLQDQCGSIKAKVIFDTHSQIIIRKLQTRRIVFKLYRGEYKADVFREFYKSILDSFIQDGVDISSINSSPLAILKTDNTSSSIELKIGYELKSDFTLNKYSQENIIGGEYACYIHEGNYDSLMRDLYGIIRSNIEKIGYKVIGPSVVNYYINEAVTPIRDNFITEIQFPINKK